VTTEDAVLERFKEGLARDRLELPRCTDCDRIVWYPRARCPHCTSSALTWTVLSGAGTVHSYTVNRRGHGEYADKGPFVIAYVELAEGPRVLAHLATAPDEARIGAPVRMTSGLGPEGRVRLTFVPDDPDEEGGPTA
jgi:uncharacterized OB-fold protein